MTAPSEFWNLLAPHHAGLEDNYFNLASLRAIADFLPEPVLVVGAGQGLIVAGLKKRGVQCEGVDSSPEMIKYAKLRRGLTLIEADARAMPFQSGTKGSIIYATGVIDFMGDVDQIRRILEEGRRVVCPSGNTFVAFYRLSPAGEDFVAKVGLLKNNLVDMKRSMELYLLNPAQMVKWVANQAGISSVKATLAVFNLAARNTLREKVTTFRMQKVFRNKQVAQALLNAVPQIQPYRNEAEIRRLFQGLAIPIKQVYALQSCWIAQI